MATTNVHQPAGGKVEEVIWTAEELDIVERPNGPALAAFIASGIGAFVLGLLTTWAEASADFADTLKLQNRVGPLSGKVTFSGIAFVIAWAVLAPLLWKKNLPWMPALVVGGAFLVMGFIGTYPEFFQRFE